MHSNLSHIKLLAIDETAICAQKSVQMIDTDVDLTFSIPFTHWGRDKMATISRWHFQMHFLEWKCKHFD